jgi:hypothetical protein
LAIRLSGRFQVMSSSFFSFVGFIGEGISRSFSG